VASLLGTLPAILPPIWPATELPTTPATSLRHQLLLRDQRIRDQRRRIMVPSVALVLSLTIVAAATTVR
jgi:hypothetical protein